MSRYSFNAQPTYQPQPQWGAPAPGAQVPGPFSAPVTVQQTTRTFTADSPQGILQEKVKLAENAKEREQYDNMADLYSIFITTERLEKAFIKDSINATEYTKECTKLIAKYKALLTVVKDVVPDVNKFIQEYKMSCPAAVNRLVTIGVPATVEHGGDNSDDKKTTKLVAETVAYFITAMDSLKLEMATMSDLQPLINDLMDSLNKCPLPDFEGKGKIKNWLITLNQMRATDKLSDDQIRQMLFDLESAYNAFHKVLAGK